MGLAVLNHIFMHKIISRLIRSESRVKFFLTERVSKKSLKKNYKGYQLLRAFPDLQWKVHELLDLEEEADGSGVMWWTAPSLNGTTDLLVPPDLLSDIKEQLKSLKIEFQVVIWDLQVSFSHPIKLL